MVLLIDNFDSFSHILGDYFKQLGKELFIVRNDINPDKVNLTDFEAVVISPGPETPDKAGNLMALVDKCIGTLPILGICLGHQALGQYFGAKLSHGAMPVHGKVHRIYQIQPHLIFNQIPKSFMVTRYHSLILTELPEGLIPIAETEIGELMAFAHQSLPIVGIQYHPEAHLTQYGLQILANWFDWVSSDKAIVSEKNSALTKVK